MVLLFCFYEKFPVWHSPVYWLNKYLSQFLCFRCSLSGVSPFQGETVEETCRRITDVNYEFNPKHFDPISQQAKDFITALLVKNPKWVKAHSKLFFSLFFFFLFFYLFSRKLATLLVRRVHRTEIYAKVLWIDFLKFPFSFTELRFFWSASGIDFWRWPKGSKPWERECQISRWRGPHWLEDFMTKLDSDTSGRSTLFPGSFFLPRGTLRTPQFMRAHSDKFLPSWKLFSHWLHVIWMLTIYHFQHFLPRQSYPSAS